MNFQGVVCWDAANIDLIAPIDVASLEHDPENDASIFLATHQSLPLIHLPSSSSTDGQLIDERTLLDEFSKPAGNDPRITIIRGAVGTGKSHMVKWLHAACAGREDWHQIYIEKRNTNLRRVIEVILSGLSGPRVIELREQLQTASSAVESLDEAKSRVLQELSHRVQFPSDGYTVASEQEKEARKQLPFILDDPVLSQHLLQDGGAIHRITKLGFEGLLRDDENEHDLFLHAEDLPLSPSDLTDASKPAQRAIRLLGSSKHLRDAAVSVLNRALAVAKASVFLGGGIDLIGLFDEVRMELEGRGLELVLYIEDLVLLHGIDLELAQVFTEGRGSSGKRCSMRVAIAVTEGYLASGFETLTTRAEHYSLNLKLGDHVSNREAQQFVGRYLNAIRVGPEKLRLARTPNPSEWVPNACVTCDFHEECHSAFGADENGHGFYPLNSTALDKLVDLADTATTAEKRFDPRQALRHVVRDPLHVAASELPEHRFPSVDFGASVDPKRRSVAVEVRSSLEGTTDGDRLISLLNFWSPGRIEQVSNLESAIHYAFALPEVVGVQPPGRPGITKPPPPPTPRVDWAKVDDWSNDEGVLPSPIARSIRQLIFDAVLEQVRSGATGIRVRGANRRFDVGTVPFDENSVRIEAAQGGGSEVARLFEIKVERSAPMAVMLKALLTAGTEGGWSAENLGQYVRFISCVDDWAHELVSLATSRTVDVVPALDVLALTGQPQVAAATTAGERLEAALQARPESNPRGAHRQNWAKIVERARESSIGALEGGLTGAKGIGASTFLDAAPIVHRLDKAHTMRALGDQLRGSHDFVELQKRLRDQQTTTAEHAWTEIDRTLTAVADFIDFGQPWASIRQSVEAAIGFAHDSGFLPTATEKDELANLADAVPDDALPTAKRLASSGDRQLWALMPDPWSKLDALHRYCSRVSETFSVIEGKLAAEYGVQVGSVGPGAAAVTMRALADALDAVLPETNV